jgi:hypothetical protein
MELLLFCIIVNVMKKILKNIYINKLLYCILLLHNLLFSGRTNIYIHGKLQDCLKLGHISNCETCKNPRKLNISVFVNSN